MADELDRLARWADHGGTCRLIDLDADSAVVVLNRCDGGEEADRFRTHDPATIAWVRAHAS